MKSKYEEGYFFDHGLGHNVDLTLLERRFSVSNELFAEHGQNGGKGFH